MKKVKNVPKDICNWCSKIDEIFTFNVNGEIKNICDECWRKEFVEIKKKAMFMN